MMHIKIPVISALFQNGCPTPYRQRFPEEKNMPIYFSNDLNREPFQFDSVGNHWLQESVHRPKGHPHYHYLQTEEGCGILTIDGKEQELPEEHGILIAPYVPHAYRAADTSAWITCFATFGGTMETHLPQMLGNDRMIFTEKEYALEIKTIIDRAVTRFETAPGNAHPLSCDCYALLLQFSNGFFHASTHDPAWEKYVQPVLQLIRTHYMEDLTAEALSRQVYVSPQYLSRLFARYLGCSVYEYVTSYRITKAKELLLTRRDRKIQEIAQDVGYADSSHFIVMFKKLTGMTPAQFRRQ